MRVIGVTMRGAFSGADDAILQGLRSRQLLVNSLDGRLPDVWQLFLLIKSFRPSKHGWYSAWQRAVMKSPFAFKARTRELDRALRDRLTQYDVVLQIGGLFSPFCGD